MQMHNRVQLTTIEWWLADVRESFIGTEPDLLSVFDTYAAEAAFGRQYIDSDLGNLKPGAKVLEIGAGSLLLCCQLVREGFQVTGLEPTGSGFLHFEIMHEIILNRANTLGCVPQILNLPAEALKQKNIFDFAFSINVMEHVDDVDFVIINALRSLKVGACYRFTCPNYLFPYEPHFNIPTLFSKRLTERILSNKILNHETISDTSGTWKSLNWISVLQIRRIVRRLPGIKMTLNRRFLVTTFERLNFDIDFASRRSPLILKFILPLVRLRAHKLFCFIPAMLQPTIDCKLEKNVDSEVW